MSIKKQLNFFDLIYYKKEKNPIDFPIDKTNVDSNLFHNSFGHFLWFFRVIRQNKIVFRETYLIKEFTFEPSLEYQCFNLTAELYLTKKKFLFFSKI